MKKFLFGLLFLFSSIALGGSVNLAWTPPTTGPTPAGYNIYWGTASGVYGPTPMQVGTVTTATVPNLTNGVQYFFALKSRDAVGNQSAAFSNEVFITIPIPLQPPTLLSPTATATVTITATP